MDLVVRTKLMARQRRRLAAEAALAGECPEAFAPAGPRTHSAGRRNRSLLDVWRAEHTRTREVDRKRTERVSALKSKLEKLDDAFLYQHSIDRTNYDRQHDRVEEELAVAEVRRVGGGASWPSLDADTDHVPPDVVALVVEPVVGLDGME